MSRGTKAILLTASWVILTSWAFLDWRPGWEYGIPYYRETAAELSKGRDALQQQSDSARTSEYGVYVEQNIAVIGGVYALFAFFLLLNPGYRSGGWRHLWLLSMVLVVVIPCFILGAWIMVAFRDINHAQGSVSDQYRRGIGSWLIYIVTGIIWPLMTIALGLVFWFALWIGIPLYLLFLLVLLPSILYVILRLLVRLPVLTYHYLHYLSVPHPAETAYRAGIANDLPTEELASTVAEAMYQYELKDFDALPRGWKSKNWTKRINAFHDRLKAEDQFMEELIKNLRLQSEFRE